MISDAFHGVSRLFLDTAPVIYYIDLLVTGAYTQFVTIGKEAGIKAASLRAQYNLSLMDALQIAVALLSSCDAFLTNDLQLRRVSDMRILVMETL